MTNYQALKSRLEQGDVIVLDGAVGTQLQGMGVPMDPYCWAAMANHTHPYTVRKMHEDYIRAGVDIITTNTYSAARHNYEAVGLTDQTIEMNLRAVALAQEARDRVAEKPVYIAGSISNFGGWTEQQIQRWQETGQLKGRTTTFGLRIRDIATPEQIRRNLREQAEILAEAGVDFIVGEATGDEGQRAWVLEAAASAGLPYWAGFKCHVPAQASDAQVSEVRVSYGSDLTLAEELEQKLPLDCEVLVLFHSSIEDTNEALPLVQDKWTGPLGIYPEAGRRDYVHAFADPNVENPHSVEAFVETAQDWVAKGVQIIGGCCGVGLDYIRALEGQLPQKVGERL